MTSTTLSGLTVQHRTASVNSAGYLLRWNSRHKRMTSLPDHKTASTVGSAQRTRRGLSAPSTSFSPILHKRRYRHNLPRRRWCSAPLPPDGRAHQPGTGPERRRRWRWECLFFRYNNRRLLSGMDAAPKEPSRANKSASIPIPLIDCHTWAGIILAFWGSRPNAAWPSISTGEEACHRHHPPTLRRRWPMSRQMDELMPCQRGQ